jgi:adenylosuccinate lyase
MCCKKFFFILCFLVFKGRYAMIPRYARKKMLDIFNNQTKFKIWLDIERFACEAQEKLGVIPSGVAAKILEKGNFDALRIEEIEAEVKHDIIAFLTNVAEYVGEDARFIHQGMTSSDVVDTCLCVQLKNAADIIIEDLDSLLDAIKIRAFETKDLVCIGRSHGIHAEPVTIGLKFASFYAEFLRNKQRLINARDNIAVCAISGAVGTFANIDPFVEEYVAEKMGLKIEPISTQVIPRDRHAEFFATLGVIASSMERVAVEIRHLQRTEVREAEEFFSKNQKGSSAMPHKRNPVLSENITGLARVVRGYVNPALENVALWHERDISHSSVERIIAPDALITLDFALSRLTGVVKEMVFYPENIKANLEKLKGLIFSQRILLTLTQKGVARETAYRIVQRNAMKVWQENRGFLDILKEDEELLSVINEKELESLFDLSYHTKHVDTIFNRVFR